MGSGRAVKSKGTEWGVVFSGKETCVALVSEGAEVGAVEGELYGNNGAGVEDAESGGVDLVVDEEE